MFATQTTTRSLKMIAVMAVCAVLVTGCKKEFDAPPIRTIPVGEKLTVQQLRDLLPTDVLAKRFTGDSSVFAVVTADEQSGNLYRNVYVQDHTAAIQLRLLSSGSLYQGDSIRIYLKGTTLSWYRGMMQLDSVDVDNNIVKQATNVYKAPLDVTISEVTPALQGMLVRVNDVEFLLNDACGGATYANAVTRATMNKNVTNCAGDELIVRTSGYASFAGQQLPTGNGSIIGVLGQFQDDMQLFIRNINEVRFDSPERCMPCPMACEPIDALNENFSMAVSGVDIVENIHTTEPCWYNEYTQGNRKWRGFELSGNMAAQATSFNSNNQSDVAWLLTPPVNYSPGKALSFRTTRRFGSAGHDPFALFISTNYTLNSPETATWTPVQSNYATPATADQVWVSSGQIDLGQYLPAGYTGRFVIGFRYTGSGPSGQTTNFLIDDVVIQ